MSHLLKIPGDPLPLSTSIVCRQSEDLNSWCPERWVWGTRQLWTQTAADGNQGENSQFCVSSMSGQRPSPMPDVVHAASGLPAQDSSHKMAPLTPLASIALCTKKKWAYCTAWSWLKMRAFFLPPWCIITECLVFLGLYPCPSLSSPLFLSMMGMSLSKFLFLPNFTEYLMLLKQEGHRYFIVLQPPNWHRLSICNTWS